jgi:hypothetical protein
MQISKIARNMYGSDHKVTSYIQPSPRDIKLKLPTYQYNDKGKLIVQ